MEEYIVSARKYRPLSFDSVVGQRALTTTLKNSIASGKLAHAYLFCGPRGVGKTTCARIFAKAINCQSPREGGDACGQCESCRAFDEQRSLNIHELDAASNNSVEDIRELCKQVLIPPQTGRYKVFIIDEVHMLSSSAFNAFLKTLEEPPSYVIFILATTEKHKILPTILSRCQVYDFQRMTTQGTVDHLKYVAEKEGYTAEPEALALIAEKADGGMRDALSIFDQMVSFTAGQLTYERVCQSLNVLNTEYYFRFVDHFLKCEVEPCLLLLNEILMKGYDAGNLIGGLSGHLRNLLVSRDEATLPLLEMSDKMRERFNEQALRCQPRFLYRAIKLCNDCDQSYRTSRNKRLQVEICLIQAAQLMEDDAIGSGRGPAKILKPIFSKLAQARGFAAGTQENANVGNATLTNTTSTASTQAPVPAGRVLQKTSIIEQMAQRSEKTEKKQNLRMVAFKNFGGAKNTKNDNDEIAVHEEDACVPINEERLHSAWISYIQSLPDEEVGFAQRLRNMQATVLSDSSFYITAGNPIVQSQMESARPEILQFMRKFFHNNSLEMVVKVANVQVAQKSYDKTERLKEMREGNHAVSLLINELKLMID